MYAYAWDGPVEVQGNSALSRSGGSEPHGQEGSNYVILTVSLAGLEITWCWGPGISTIFAAKSESPHDYCVLSRRSSA